MAKVFICYQRSDSPAVSGRIYDRLVARFGKENIFKDVDDIPIGVRFSEFIHATLKQCPVELVIIIGRDWLTAKTALRQTTRSRQAVRLSAQDADRARCAPESALDSAPSYHPYCSLCFFLARLTQT